MSGSGTSIFCLGEPDAAHADTWQSKLTQGEGDEDGQNAAFPWPVKVKDRVRSYTAHLLKPHLSSAVAPPSLHVIVADATLTTQIPSRARFTYPFLFKLF